MPTAAKRTPTSRTLSYRQRQKAEERARLAAARRVRRLRRLVPIPALIVIAIIVYLVVQSRQGTSSGATLRLDSSVGSGTGLAWSPAGTELALSGDSGGRDANIWDTANGHLIRRLYGDGQVTNDLAWSQDGRYLAVGAEPVSAVSTARAVPLDLWRATNWTRLSTAAAPSGPAARWLAFSPDGTLLAAQDDRALQVLAVPSLRRVAIMNNPLGTASIHPVLAWSPDGKTLAAGITGANRRGTSMVALLDGRTLARRHDITIAAGFPGNLIGAIAWSPDGSEIAIGGLGGRVAIYDAHFGRKLRDLDHDLNSIATLAWARDGLHLAAGGNGGLAIWDTQTGKVLHDRQEPVDVPGSGAVQNTVLRVAWSPDAHRLAISGNNALPEIWTPPALKP